MDMTARVFQLLEEELGREDYTDESNRLKILGLMVDLAACQPSLSRTPEEENADGNR